MKIKKKGQSNERKNHRRKKLTNTIWKNEKKERK